MRVFFFIKRSVLATSSSRLSTTIASGGLNCRVPVVQISFQYFVLAPTYSRLSTTIGPEELNCRVRNENGCILSGKALAQNTETASADLITGQVGMPGA